MRAEVRWLPAILLLMGTLGLSSVVTGCRRTPPERLRVAVSLAPLADLTRRVAGDDADVAVVVEPSSIGATVAPSPSGVAAVAAAHLVVVAGLGLDGAVENAKSPSARVLRLGDRVPTLPAPGRGGEDPYPWVDPQRARLMVRALGEELARSDSAHTLAYRRRASELDGVLEALDREVEARMEPWRDRARLLSADPSPVAAQERSTYLAYFVDRYKLEAGDGSPSQGAAAGRSLTSAEVLHTASYEALVGLLVTAVAPP